jgi:error-prone DNA polymerase
MGFYAPAQIVRDAQDHGVEVRPIDVNHSRWDCALEPVEGHHALRLGMRMIRSMREPEANAITQAIERDGFAASMETLWRRSGVRLAALRALAAADAFSSMGLDRQASLWQIHSLHDIEAPLFDGIESASSTEHTELPAIAEPRKVAQDYATVGLTLRPHPVSFLRPKLDLRGVVPASSLRDGTRFPHGTRARVAGLIVLRQRPGTAGGIVFMTMEDETGSVNLIVRPQI